MILVPTLRFGKLTTSVLNGAALLLACVSQVCFISSLMGLLQGIFQTEGLNPSLLDCRQILYHLSHWGRGVGTGVGLF